MTRSGTWAHASADRNGGGGGPMSDGMRCGRMHTEQRMPSLASQEGPALLHPFFRTGRAWARPDPAHPHPSPSPARPHTARRTRSSSTSLRPPLPSLRHDRCNSCISESLRAATIVSRFSRQCEHVV
eukprot:7121376-Prymnesium_polylepis.1